MGRAERLRGLAAAALCLPLLAPAAWRAGGHLKGTALSREGGGTGAGTRQALDLRFTWEGRRAGGWEGRLHLQWLAAGGQEGSGGLAGRVLPDDRRRLLRLARRGSTAGWEWVQRVDRLSLGYARGRQVLRVGRQVVGWGNGLVFQPMDFLSPFAPTAIDTAYKVGDDMVYYQRLWDDGGDLQAVWVGRRDPATGRAEAGLATWAAKQRFLRGGATLDLLAARHYGQEVAGAGLAADWRGGVLRLDLVRAGAGSGPPAWLAVVNADRSWAWRGRNVYGYLEYFHNGFGGGPGTYARPREALAARLARGELFTLGRDYLAAGLQVEWTPRWQWQPLLIANLGDGSGLFQGRVRWDWRADLDLEGAVILAWGGGGSEFGGFVRDRVNAYIRASLYF